MKKLILTIGVMVATATGLFAQGFATLANTASIAFSTNSAVSTQFGGSGGSVGSAAAGFVGVGYYFEVLTRSYSGTLTADTNVWDGSWLDTALETSNKANGQPGVVTAQAAVEVNNWAAGTTNQIVIVGWSASLGSSWTAVSALAATGFTGNLIAGYFGVSTVSFEAATTSAGPAYPAIWSTAGPQTYGNPIASGFTLYAVPTTAVPEPCTIALAGLGGVSLLLFRRRKS
jgi:hypothetical protein